MSKGPALGLGQILPVTAVRTTLFLSLAQLGSVSGSPYWDLVVIHGCDKWSSVIELGKGMAVLWNLLKAGVVFIPLPKQIYPREFFFTQKEWPPHSPSLKGTNGDACLTHELAFTLGTGRPPQQTQCTEPSKQ